MKNIKAAIALLPLLMAAGAGNVWADRGHHGHHGGSVHFGVVVGPYWSPWYYPQPYYYPPVVIERPVPQVYVEQQPVIQAAPVRVPTNYWYYCAAAKTYYPYVKDCPGGWQKVSPQPPGQP